MPIFIGFGMNFIGDILSTIIYANWRNVCDNIVT